MSDSANEAGDDKKRDKDFEKEETSHQEWVKDGYEGPDALWIKAVDTCLRVKNFLI